MRSSIRRSGRHQPLVLAFLTVVSSSQAGRQQTRRRTSLERDQVVLRQRLAGDRVLPVILSACASERRSERADGLDVLENELALVDEAAELGHDRHDRRRARDCNRKSLQRRRAATHLRRTFRAASWRGVSARSRAAGKKRPTLGALSRASAEERRAHGVSHRASTALASYRLARPRTSFTRLARGAEAISPRCRRGGGIGTRAESRLSPRECPENALKQPGDAATLATRCTRESRAIDCSRCSRLTASSGWPAWLSHLSRTASELVRLDRRNSH